MYIPYGVESGRRRRGKEKEKGGGRRAEDGIAKLKTDAEGFFPGPGRYLLEVGSGNMRV